MLGRTLDFVAASINTSLEDYSPVQIMAITMASYAGIRIAIQTYDSWHHWNTRSICESLINSTLMRARQLPYVGQRIDGLIRKEVISSLRGLKAELDSTRRGLGAEVIYRLPDEAMALEDIRALYPAFESTYEKGKLSGGVYVEYSPEVRQLLESLYGKYALTNPMHSVFKDLKKKEAEVIAWCADLFHAPAGTHGVITAGGTLSIYEACKSYVLHARKHGISQPEIVMPSTAHPAFQKAAEDLNATLVIIPVDKNTGKADIKAMKAAMSRHTCMMVASGMSFPHGVMDPVAELADACLNHHDYYFRKRSIPLHVDSCLGGFITAFADQAGYPQLPCDFSIKGVTSISADIHKFGDGPKGASMLLMRQDPALLINPSPTFTKLTSAVGSYVTPGLPGSRSGVQIATAHAVMLTLGKQGYIAQTKAILDLRKELAKTVRQIPHIIIPFQTDLPVVGMRTPGLNALVVAEQMKKRGYELNCLLTENYQPDGFHFCVTASHTTTPDFVKQFTTALSESVAFVENNPGLKPTGIAKAYGVLATGFVPTAVQEIIGDVYVKTDQSLPGAPVPGFF